MTKFSVLLSVYKNESPHNLKESIESISLQQSLIPAEIILIKDGMLTYELERTIHDLQKEIPYLKVYGYKENKGLGYALNFGLVKCRFDLVFRMDTDDISFPNRFEKQLKFLKTNPKTSIVGSTIQEFNQIPGDIDQKRKVPLKPEEIDLKKNHRNPFNHMTVLFKKPDVQKVGGYIDMPGYEDYYLWMRLLKAHKGINIEEPLVYARIGNNMIKRRQGIKFLKKEIQFQNTLLNDKLIDLSIYLRNILLRGIPRILPSFILNVFYKQLLRK